MNRIKVIQSKEAEGRLKGTYSQLEQQRGQIADVHKIQSLRPESIVKHMDLYMEIKYSKSELSRAQREMMAVMVSKTNNCNYCIKHYASPLQMYWKDENKVERLKKNFLSIELSVEGLALCVFYRSLTKTFYNRCGYQSR